MKIKAYTIMEVTITMLLFAIVVSMSYAAYGIVSNYYSKFHQKNKAAYNIISLKNVMERDFLKSSCILKIEDGFEVIIDTTKIYYSFKEQGIQRTFNALHTDSFKIKFKDLTSYFQSNPISTIDTIDQINFTVIVDKLAIPVQVNKKYSAKDLFN